MWSAHRALSMEPMTIISFAVAGVVGLLSYSIGYNTHRIRRKRPSMVRRVN